MRKRFLSKRMRRFEGEKKKMNLFELFFHCLENWKDG